MDKQWQSLSDDEVRQIRVKYAGLSWIEGFWRFYNDIEQALTPIIKTSQKN